MLQVQNIPTANLKLPVTAKVGIYLVLMALVQGIHLQKQADLLALGT